jgi:hypothetical protein
MTAVIGMGQSGSGKTYTLFGGDDGSAASEGFAMRAVEAVLNKIRHTASPEDYGIAVAFWEVRACTCISLPCWQICLYE